MRKLAKVVTVSLLGLAYTLATPVISVSVFDDGLSATKAFADVPRDPGRQKKERNKDNPG